MKITLDTIRSVWDEAPLSIAFTHPQSHPKGIFQIVHGMSEHKERYFPFMEYLSANGYFCIIHDMRGHGQSVLSERDLGYFGKDPVDKLVADTDTVMNYAKSRYPDTPVILMGHSMGSMTVRSYTKRHDQAIRGLIVCGSPSYNPAAPAGRILAKADGLINGRHHRSPMIHGIAFEAFNRKFRSEGSPNAWLCTDSQTVAQYDADRLCGFTFTSDGFDGLFALMQDCYSSKGWQRANASLEILFISGEQDPCMGSAKKMERTIQVMLRAGYTRIRRIIYPEMRHEILSERDKAKVWKDILMFADETCR